MFSNLWEAFLSDPAYHLYWIVAIAASVLFCVQLVFLLVGFDADSDFSGGDMQFDLDGLSLVSVKTVACFLLGFGWTGALCYPYVDNGWLLAGISLSVGVIFLLLMALLIRQLMQLAQDASFRTENTVGSIADVYLRIPAGKGKLGKVTVSIDGSTHELMARSADGGEITTGAKVRITEIIDEGTVRVEPLA